MPVSSIAGLVTSSRRQGAQENNPDLDEIMLETQAQLDKAVRLGLDIKYAEMHMGYGWVVDGLNEAFDSWCREKGIINSIPMGKRLPETEHKGNPVEVLIERIKDAEPGYYALIGHPAYDNEEMRALGNDGYPGKRWPGRGNGSDGCSATRRS